MVKCFSNWEQADVGCENCGWSGRGSQTLLGEVSIRYSFWERLCPGCYFIVLVVEGFTQVELEQAAADGHPVAVVELAKRRSDGLEAVTEEEDDDEL